MLHPLQAVSDALCQGLNDGRFRFRFLLQALLHSQRGSCNVFECSCLRDVLLPALMGGGVARAQKALLVFELQQAEAGWWRARDRGRTGHTRREARLERWERGG